MGNFVEWYDFGVYSFLATTIARVFFPAGTSAALVGTFGILAISFIMRPIGGFVLGTFGDRIGRKRVLTFTITVMAVSTSAIGLLPGYDEGGFWSAGIGVWAVVALAAARTVQGFSTGGEYVGAMIYIAEHAPDRRRGFMGGFLPVGTLAGYVCGAALVTGLQAGSATTHCWSWGWRIPFLLSAPLGGIALYMRLKLKETAAFEQTSEEQDPQEQKPGRQFTRTFVEQWPYLLVCLGLVVGFNVTNYMLTGYLPTFLSDVLDVGMVPGRTIVTAVLLILLIAVVFVARLSDRIGRRPVMWFGCGLMVFGSVPAVALMRFGDSYFVIGVGVLIVGVMLLCFNSTEPSTLPTLFPTNVRYGALATSFNIGVSAFGGTVPLIAEVLVSGTGDLYVPAYILIVAGIIAGISVAFLPESARRRLRGSGPAVTDEDEARYVASTGTLEDPESPETGITEVEPGTDAKDGETHSAMPR